MRSKNGYDAQLLIDTFKMIPARGPQTLHAMLSMLCYLCFAISDVGSMPGLLDNKDCPQVLRARHLWTMRVFSNPPMLSLLCYIMLSMLCYLCYAISDVRSEKHALSTGASREAPVDNACFSEA